MDDEGGATGFGGESPVHVDQSSGVEDKGEEGTCVSWQYRTASVARQACARSGARAAQCSAERVSVVAGAVVAGVVRRVARAICSLAAGYREAMAALGLRAESRGARAMMSAATPGSVARRPARACESRRLRLAKAVTAASWDLGEKGAATSSQIAGNAVAAGRAGSGGGAEIVAVEL